MARGPSVVRPSPRYAAPVAPMRRPARPSRWCRPWARCTRAHLALVRAGAPPRRTRVVVSIFVNPDAVRAARGFRQLSAHASRPISRRWPNCKVDAGLGADGRHVMYPEGFATRIVPEGAALAGLEDKFRPHFFGGVATVVAKLFTQVHAGRRAVRREGLPAAPGRRADGARPRSCR